MGYQIGSVVNSAADWACRAPVIKSIAFNPVLTSLMFTAIVCIVALSVYRRPIKREGRTKAARAAIYVFMAATAVSFLHHYALERDVRDKTYARENRSAFRSIQANGGGDVVPVTPRTAWDDDGTKKSGKAAADSYSTTADSHSTAADSHANPQTQDHTNPLSASSLSAGSQTQDHASSQTQDHTNTKSQAQDHTNSKSQTQPQANILDDLVLTAVNPWPVVGIAPPSTAPAASATPRR
jgi:hypothetical protein